MSKKFKNEDLMTSSADIASVIFTEYIEELKNSNIPDVLSDLPLLLQNNRASMFKETSYSYTSYPTLVRVASSFIQKYNKELKSHRRVLSDFEFGGKNNTKADDNKTLLKLAGKVLPNGVYYAQLDYNNFMIIRITEVGEYSDDECTVVFVGEDHLKYKNKFVKYWDKFKRVSDDDKREFIRDITGRDEPRQIIFKPFEHVIFKDKDKIIKYIDNWRKNIPTYYNRHKMIAKLSVILYGDPGTGKSTFGKALAKYLGMNNVVTVPPSYFTKSNEGGSKRLYISDFVISLDDIDCYCQSREDSKDKDNNEALAALLQFLDNPPTTLIKCDDGVQYPVSIVVASTNYYDKLDDAVKRYGRFDLKVHMPLFTAKEAQEMCDLYGLQLEDLVKDSKEEDFTISPSELQAICLEHVDSDMKNTK